MDVETTGLDRKHDEIIQIGIVEFSADGKKIREFSSYVKPTQTTELQWMVNLITGISIEQLLDAPSRADIAHEITPYFWPTTVIIGHSLWFDLHFVQRMMPLEFYAQIDTLPLAQALVPYSQSYALEILAKHHIPWLREDGFHDALVDSIITGQLFFALVKKCEALFYTFPYLREVSKRTQSGIATCMTIEPDARFLLKEIPVLETYATTSTKPIGATLPEGTRYVWATHISDIVKHTPLASTIIATSHHPKSILVQKACAAYGMTTTIYDQTFLDPAILHRFFTQATFTQEERYCAAKYITHTNNHHGSYHAVNAHDHRFVKALQLHTWRASQKRIFDQFQLFSAIAQGHIGNDEHLVIFDKEWLFTGFKKWKYAPIDIYHFADTIEALIYKQTLLGGDTTHARTLLHSLYIFLGIRWGAARALCLDMKAEEVRMDDVMSMLSFSHAMKVWGHIRPLIDTCHHYYDAIDMAHIERGFSQIDALLMQPHTIVRKWAHHEERYIIQPIDTFTSRDDILHVLAPYKTTILSVLDTKFPVIPVLPASLEPGVLRKWKEIKVTDQPKLCIITPSKKAAQDLLLSLHKSPAYADTFLAAENVTWGAGKIFQQVQHKSAYILLGGYNFCLQSIAQWVKFDTIGALDIIENNGISTFMDIVYYAGTPKTTTSEN
jgi:DNA polymerase III epsilon subunit-like protein